MMRLRACLLSRRGPAFALLALVLAVKALVPAGYMIDGDARGVTVRICADAAASVHAVVIPGKQRGDADQPGHDQQACPFAALGHAALGGADPLLLAAALVFILLIGLVPVPAAAPRASARLRPPLRAPPAFA